MRIRPLSRTCLATVPHKESSASCCDVALVRRFLRPCVFHLARPFLPLSLGTLLRRFQHPSAEVFSAPLCSCSGALFRRAQKTRLAAFGQVGTPQSIYQFTSGLALTRPILPLSRRLRRSRLLTRRSHSATFTIGHRRAAWQPPGFTSVASPPAWAN